VAPIANGGTVHRSAIAVRLAVLEVGEDRLDQLLVLIGTVRFGLIAHHG
jgi:hypothetical protein